MAREKLARWFKIVLSVICFYMMGAAPGKVAAQNVKKSGPINFQVPEDWPVEKRGGLLVPVSTEEYVSGKFKNIDQEFLTLREESESKWKSLESEINEMGSNLSDQIKASVNQQGQTSSSASGLDAPPDLFTPINDEIARLNRLIMNREREMRAELEQLKQQVSALEEALGKIQARVYKVEEKTDYIKETYD